MLHKSRTPRIAPTHHSILSPNALSIPQAGDRRDATMKRQLKELFFSHHFFWKNRILQLFLLTLFVNYIYPCDGNKLQEQKNRKATNRLKRNGKILWKVGTQGKSATQGPHRCRHFSNNKNNSSRTVSRT